MGLCCTSCVPLSCLLTHKHLSNARSPLPPQDGNVGLVKLAIEGQAKRQIQKLTQTYLTLRCA